LHQPPARLQVFPIYRAQLLPDGIYYNAPQLLQYIPRIFRRWSLVCGAIPPRRLQVTGLHKRSAHRTSIFGPKTWVPDAGLRLWGCAVALAGLRRSSRRHRLYVSARPRGGHGSRRWPMSSGAHRRLGGSLPVRSETSTVGLRPAARGPGWCTRAVPGRLRLSTCTHLGKIVCLISSEVRRPPPSWSEAPVSRNRAASA